MARRSILVVDDEQGQREIISAILADAGYDVTTASSGEAALRFVDNRRFDLVLTDYQMSGMTGLDLLRELTNFDKSIIVILISAYGTIDTAVDALRLGAFDYLQKPYDRDKLLETISRALNRLSGLDSEIISMSSEMDRVKKLILKVSKSNATVLIKGESGTGKELIARAIHQNGARASETFQAVNCAAINENLLESELFGHEKGSFTGAVGEKKGLFEIANGGTLFLDEIGELDVSLQAKLLRALQEKQIRRVGGVKEINVDVRVVAATNRDLLKMTEDGRFREDLYYRLNVISIEVPPLRERPGDLRLLIDRFLEKHTVALGLQVRLADDARRALENYSYPGNVRQLDSAIERAAILCDEGLITLADLPPEIGGVSGAQIPVTSGFILPEEGVNFEEVEKNLIMQALRRTDNNITKSAKLLGMTFRTLQYRLEKFGIRRDASTAEGDE